LSDRRWFSDVVAGHKTRGTGTGNQLP